ncbi:MAG: ATP-dependent DNA helicase RecQ [Muribaculaceae bacterium]|nr:RecQ family ATP-dependent DNA helicase [Muribaculaceae bacterium]MDD6943908.1 RecQ family ATP-dependent DNA helicase [Bacteroidales bacterium]MDY2732852.1 ATP-dependent DNA helicase RecQ [Muribaculaceae bacterium]MDY4650127.1 ATP-dependent DNA helicase RecQ [Muribaculaceae bacterium]MDY5387478.1 ATP-dependent DNA helicase RecQ [Muribaculaceae bacterium]
MDALETLRRYWGYDSFRPLQSEIVTSALSGHDTLGLMPTGGGKSITFQVPGLMMEGVTIVVTPLISLMKDQVDNLKRRRIKAVTFHSGMTRHEHTVALEKLINGGAKFLYVSPERLRNDNFLSLLRGLKVSQIVVDEAHCISQWGYDFRPAYLNIKKLRKVKPDVAILALTATATPEVARDICEQLEMRDPAVYRMSFTRDNINYIVRPAETKIYEVFHILSRTQGSSIVYVRSRKRTVEISEYLSSAGISATAYHAGLDYELKEKRQNSWQMGETRVMVATNAFGMGIDKPDVRVVIHYDMPPSLEEYYQEAGRAGRDGKRSYAVLLTSKRDQALMRRRVTESFPDREIIRKIYERICNVLNVSLGEGYGLLKEFDIEKFCDLFGYQERQCRSAIHLLQQAGYLEYMEEGDRGSRVMMTCHRDELYDLHGVSPRTERVLTGILRTYTGLFTEYVNINESSMARNLQLSEREIYESLLELGRMKILSYIPRSRIPLIYLPTSREEPRYIEIGKKIYEDRRATMSRRVEAMLSYAYDSHECRENRMIRYFGEERETGCGHCDVCRSRRDNGKVSLKEMIGKIWAYLEEKPSGVDIRILEQEIKAPEGMIREALSYLGNEGYISTEMGIIKIKDG